MTRNSYLECTCPAYGSLVVAKGDQLTSEVGFQDGGCFSRFSKRERINNETFITFLNFGNVQGRVEARFRNDMRILKNTAILKTYLSFTPFSQMTMVHSGQYNP